MNDFHRLAPSSSCLRFRVRVLGAVAVTLLFFGTEAYAQDGSFVWKMDSLRLKSKKVLNGVFLREANGEVEFAELVRRRGKSMFTIVRVLDAKDIKERKLTKGSERKQLLERYHRLKARMSVERGRMDRIQLEKAGGEWQYAGTWFVLTSNMTPEVTKQCVIRLEQIFRAYRQWIPASPPKSPLRIQLFGSMDEYSSYVHQLGLPIRNPAVYLPKKNLVIAGSNLNRYTTQLADSRAHAKELIARSKGDPNEFARQLAQLRGKLREAGFTRKEIAAEVALRRKLRDDRLTEIQKEIRRTNLKNAATFDAVTSQMFGRIRHEAFHAYMAQVARQRKITVPRWLDEGLAQVFESAHFDVDVLRIDLPSELLQKRLARDLRNAAPLPIEQILMTTSQSFIERHAASESQRSYLYSWALTEHLIARGLIGNRQRFADYLAQPSDPAQAIKHFEQFIGMPLKKFQSEWLESLREEKR